MKQFSVSRDGFDRHARRTIIDNKKRKRRKNPLYVGRIATDCDLACFQFARFSVISAQFSRKDLHFSRRLPFHAASEIERSSLDRVTRASNRFREVRR